VIEATVRYWRSEKGWGVLDSDETPGGCWAHFSSIDRGGFRELKTGERVQLEWERAEQDGWEYRAVRIVPTLQD
jgi:cold shock protein